MKIILKRNSRIFNYQEHFGSTTDFLPTLFVGGDTISDIEPVGSVMCTAFTADKVKSAETGKKYDHAWLWSQMNSLGKATLAGASPEDAFAVAVKGQKVITTGEIDTSAAYFRTDVGEYDPFTNVKSAIQMEYSKGLKRPEGCGTYWYSQWENVTVLPVGVTTVSEHEWEIVGWDDTVHPDCFQIDSHEGMYKWMPRDVFNAAMAATYGSMSLTLADSSQEVIDFLKTVQVSLIQRALDLCYNLYQVLSARLTQ